MNVDVGIDERHTDEIVVLQLPQIDFLTNGRDQKAQHMCDRRHRTLLLLHIDFFELEFGEWFAGLGHYLDDIVDENLEANEKKKQRKCEKRMPVCDGLRSLTRPLDVISSL